jgi:hypothetical protein
MAGDGRGWPGWPGWPVCSRSSLASHPLTSRPQRVPPLPPPPNAQYPLPHGCTVAHELLSPKWKDTLILRIFIVRFREIWVQTLHRSTLARNLLLHRCTKTTLHPQMQQPMHLRPHQPDLFNDAFQSSCVRQMVAGGFGGFHIPVGHSNVTHRVYVRHF